MWYKVTTAHTDLRIHADHHLSSQCIGALPQGRRVWVIKSLGRWMQADVTGYAHSWHTGWVYSGDDGRFLTLDTAGSAPGAPTAPPAAPKHLLIFFGGAASGRTPGARLTEGTSAHRAYLDILSWNLFKQPIAKNPAVSNSTYNDAINPVIQALRDRPDSDRVGSVVIYGFSAGGFNALRLCQRISREITDVFGLPTGDSRLPRRINLLITIDPCIQDAPGLPPPPNWFQGLDRTTPPVVERHINYYQPQDPLVQGDDGHYHGCPMPGPEDYSRGGTHDAMPGDTLPFLRRPIEEAASPNVDAWR